MMAETSRKWLGTRDTTNQRKRWRLSDFFRATVRAEPSETKVETGHIKTRDQNRLSPGPAEKSPKDQPSQVALIYPMTASLRRMCIISADLQ